MTVHDEHQPAAQGASERLRQTAPSAELAANAEQRPEAAAARETCFLRLLRNTRYGYVELDAGGNIREVNQRASVILGCREREALGSPFADFVHEADREAVQAGLQRVLRHVEEPPLECRIGAVAQGFQTVSLIAGLLNAEAAHPRVVYLMDVTGIPDTETALRASETQLWSLLDHVPDVVLVVSPEDRIEHINRTSWGLRSSQLTGTKLMEHFAPEDHQTALRSLETLRSTGDPQHFEVQGVDGRWLMCRAVALQEGELHIAS